MGTCILNDDYLAGRACGLGEWGERVCGMSNVWGHWGVISGLVWDGYVLLGDGVMKIPLTCTYLLSALLFRCPIDQYIRFVSVNNARISHLVSFLAVLG